jgi:hypothetical protein
MEVACEEPGRQVFFPSVNLSTSGILLGSKAPPSVGEQVRVVLSLPPDGVFVRMQGRVVRHADPPEPEGFAVVFKGVDERTRGELGEFVRACLKA